MGKYSISVHQLCQLSRRFVPDRPVEGDTPRGFHSGTEGIAETDRNGCADFAGCSFHFAGDEILRDKKGVANSYNQSDNVNAIDWRNKTTYREVFDYVRGLISMRKAHPAFRMGDPELIRKHLEFIYVPATNVVAFRIKGSPCGDKWLNTIVVLNARTEPIKVNIPEGKYWIACRDGKIDLVLGLGIITGNQITVSPRSAMIIHQ